MNTSQANFEAIRLGYASVFSALEEAVTLFDVDFYLIGAQSRDVWTHHLAVSRRITRDIDFAVFIPDPAHWSSLTTYLLKEKGFRRDPDQPYRFYLQGIADTPD